MDVTLRQLRTFLTLATVLNFRQAADELYMTQQAVSASMKQLESQLGCPLFSRSTRSVRLTDAGQRLYLAVAPIIGDLDVALITTAKEFAEQPPPLQMSFPAGGAGELTSVIMDGVRKQFPSRAFQFNDLSWDSITAGLDDGRCDLAILRIPIENERIHTVTLFDEPIMLAISRRNPLSTAATISLSEALELPVILAQKSEPVWEDFWLLGSERNQPFRIGAIVEGFAQELEAIASDLGIGFFPAFVSRLYARDDLAFLSVTGGPRAPLALGWRRDHPEAENFQLVVEHVLTHGASVIDSMHMSA